MISHVTLGKQGLPEYLETGSKATSDLGRDDKDTRIAISGSIDALKDSISWLNENKNWKNSYYHATLSFTRDEWDMVSEDHSKLQDIVHRYLELNFPRHERDELIFHAEAHVPKVLFEKYHKRGDELDDVYSEGQMVERLPHIHIGISLQNMRYTGQISSGAAVNRGVGAEKFKQTCDEMINHEFGFKNAEASRKGKTVKRNSYEDNTATWEKFALASRARSKGRELGAEIVEPIENKTKEPKMKKEEIQAIKQEAMEFWATYQERAKSLSTNLSMIYNPSETDRVIDSKYLLALKDLDAGLMIEYIIDQYGIPEDKIRKHSTENKIEVEFGGKWKKLGLTDFFTKFMSLSVDDTVRQLELFSLMNRKGIKSSELSGRSIDQIAVSDLGFERLPEFSMSVCRNLGYLIKDAAKLKREKPRKPVYAAVTDYETETRNIVEWAKELDDRIVAGYTAAIFQNGHRKLEYITAMHPVILLDLDNHKDKVQLTIDELKDKLEAKNISALIMPTASHTEEVNRARVIIPTMKPFEIPTDRPVDEWKIEYGLYAQNFVKGLGIDDEKAKAIDAVASRPAQFYYASPYDVTAVICSGVVYDNSAILDKAKLDYADLVENQRLEREAKIAERERKRQEALLAKQEKAQARAQARAMKQPSSPKVVQSVTAKPTPQDNDEYELELRPTKAKAGLKPNSPDDDIMSTMEEHYLSKLENLELEDRLVEEREDLDNDRYLTRVVLSEINKNIDIFDAVRLVFPDAYEEKSGGKVGATTIYFNGLPDGNKNLRGTDYNCIFNLVEKKTYTPIDMMRWYMNELNRDIVNYNEGLATTQLRDKLANNPLTRWDEKTRKFAEVNPNNRNNYGKLVHMFFPDVYEKICRINYRGLAYNIQKYMNNIDDVRGLEELKKHYGLKTVNLRAGRIGYRSDLDMNRLVAAGIPESFFEKPQQKSPRENFRTPSKDINFLEI